MKLALVPWLKGMWRDQKRRDLMGQYAAIGAEHQLFLADVALRGLVYSDLEAPTDRQTFINIGRRQLAQEILEACAQDPGVLFQLVEKTQPKEKPNG